MVSLIFVLNTVVRVVGSCSALYIWLMNVQGFLIGAIANVWLTDKFGFGKVSILIHDCTRCRLISDDDG